MGTNFAPWQVHDVFHGRCVRCGITVPLSIPNGTAYSHEAEGGGLGFMVVSPLGNIVTCNEAAIH
jgi:hypothetical protein